MATDDTSLSMPLASLATLLAQAHDDASGSITPPIVQSSLFSFDSYEAFEDRMTGRTDQAMYSRIQNPTVQAFEDMMAKAENADAAVAFASGMAAISSTMLALLKPGDRIACVEHVYPDAYRFFERMLRPLGIDITYHPVVEFTSSPDLLQGATIAYLESPNSVMFQAMDLEKVAAFARTHKVLTMVDNSWATPVFQRPLDSGIDIVLHSASKYISGHSDTVAGIVVSNVDVISRIRDITLPLLGGKLAPFEAWLLVRGLRTLSARMHVHERSATEFIKRLAATPAITHIHSPAPGAVKGLSGRSGLFSIELAESVDIRTLCNSLNIFKLGVSWGGFESLVLPSKVALSQAGEANSMQRFNVPGNLMRLSIGLEDVEDLWADFSSALKASTR